MPTQDQAVWATVNIAKTGGETVAYTRGELLPDPETPEEADARGLLRIGGAIRTVEVVYTPEELAARARSGAEATAARVSALDVDPSLPLGEQLPGTAQAGPPVMELPGATPVVIGPEPPAKAKTAGKDTGVKDTGVKDTGVKDDAAAKGTGTGGAGDGKDTGTGKDGKPATATATVTATATPPGTASATPAKGTATGK